MRTSSIAKAAGGDRTSRLLLMPSAGYTPQPEPQPPHCSPARAGLFRLDDNSSCPPQQARARAALGTPPAPPRTRRRRCRGGRCAPRPGCI
eukprot:1177422-Prorocentrum_minimum.AAC.3